MNPFFPLIAILLQRVSIDHLSFECLQLLGQLLALLTSLVLIMLCRLDSLLKYFKLLGGAI